jgi:hypothetical protein
MTLNQPYLDLLATLTRDPVPPTGVPSAASGQRSFQSPHQWVFIKAADMLFLVPGLRRTMLDLTIDAHFG